jgi:hypothetical protein
VCRGNGRMRTDVKGTTMCVCAWGKAGGGNDGRCAELHGTVCVCVCVCV